MAETGEWSKVMAESVVVVRGVEIHKRALDPRYQEKLLDDLRTVVRAAPLILPTTLEDAKCRFA